MSERKKKKNVIMSKNNFKIWVNFTVNLPPLTLIKVKKALLHNV